MKGAQPHLVLRHAEDVGELVPHREHPLAGRRERPAPRGRVIRAQRRPRLHRRHHDSGISQGQLGNTESISKCLRHLLRLAEEEVERHVAGNVVVELRRIRLGRRARERHGRQRLDVELHRLRRVLRPNSAVGHHARHRIAHEPYFVGRERAPDRPLHRRAVALLEVQHALVRPVRRQVRGGIDRQHPRHAFRLFNIDLSQYAVGVRTANHPRVRLPRLVQVVRVVAFPAEQRRIFSTADGFADSAHARIIADPLEHALA